MQAELENIFLVPFEDKFLLHAPLHGVSSLLNAGVAGEIRESLAAGKVNGASALARPLIEALLLPASVSFSRTGEFAPSQVRLLTTNDCNLRCLYCAPDAGLGDRSYMPVEICELSLRYQADVVRRNRYDALEVYYLGGEPFVAWDLVQFCDETGRRLAGELGVRFGSACTSNAFLSEDQARWVARHLSLVMVSLDGPADIHDHYRLTQSGRGTHDVVTRTLHIFEAERLPYVLRCSVDDFMAERLPEIVEYFCQEFKPAAINIEPLYSEGRCRRSRLKLPEPAAFVRAVVSAGRIARQHRVKLKLNTANVEHLGESNCGVCEDSFTVSPDGVVSTCCGANHRRSPQVADYAIGEVDVAAKTVRIAPSRVERVRSYKVSNIPRCRNCFAKYHCSGGCRVFHTPPFCTDPPNELCQMTQKLTLWRILECLQLFAEADRVQLEPQEVLCG